MTPAVDEVAAEGCHHRILSYDHDPNHESYGLEAAEALDIDPGQVFKTLIVEFSSGDRRPIELGVAVLPVSATLNLKAVAKLAGHKKAAMADVSKAERSTGYVAGGISPFGQRRRLRTYIDETVALWDEVLVSAGRRGLEVAIGPADLVRLLDATEAAIATS